jgi:Carboxypeptidase regulatory-like domain
MEHQMPPPVNVAPVLAVLLAVALVRPAAGQDVNGAMSGRTVTPDAIALANVSIVASGPAAQRPVEARTNASGFFLMPRLPAGVYQVTVRAIGYRPVRFDQVEIALGRTTGLGTVTMDAMTVTLTEIVVVAPVLPIDPTSTASATNLKAGTLAPLPIARDFNSFVSLAPQAIYQPPDLGFHSEGINLGGGTVADNAYYIDGLNVTQPASATTATNLPYNFIQEVQVKTGGYEAEYGRALTGIVNVITPSGGNTFHADAFTFYSGDKLTLPARYGLVQTNIDHASRFDVGADISGPVAHDHLWYYLAYNPVFDNNSAYYTGLQPQHDYRVQHRFAGKLSWQPSGVMHVVVTTVGDPTYHRGIAPFTDIGAPTSVLNPETVLAITHNGSIGGAVHVDWQPGHWSLLEVNLSRTGFRDDVTPATTLGLSAPRLTDALGTWSGGFGGTSRTGLTRTHAGATMSFWLGAHTVKAGLEYEVNRLDAGLHEENGFLIEATPTRWFWLHFVSTGKVSNQVRTGYLEDSWALTSRLRVNAGMRLEGQHFVGSDGGPVQVVNTEVAPRIGLILIPKRPESGKFFASFGRFYEQEPLDAIEEWYGAGNFIIDVYNQDPRVDPTLADSSVTPSGGVARVAGLRGQYYNEATLGYERLVGSRLKLSVHLVHRAIATVIEDNQLDDGTIRVGNPGLGQFDSLPSPSHRYDAVELTLQDFSDGPAHVLVSYVLSRDWGNYSGLWIGDGEPPNATNAFDTRDSLALSAGLLPSDRSQVLKVQGSYRFHSGLTLGSFGYVQSGTPLNDFGVTAHYQPAFLAPRGTAGRTPTTWDLALRADQPLGPNTHIILDVQHIGNPRSTVALSQGHYADRTDDGMPIDPLSTYRQVLVYQLPMSVRLGVTTRW